MDVLASKYLPAAMVPSMHSVLSRRLWSSEKCVSEVKWWVEFWQPSWNEKAVNIVIFSWFNRWKKAHQCVLQKAMVSLGAAIVLRSRGRASFYGVVLVLISVVSEVTTMSSSTPIVISTSGDGSGSSGRTTRDVRCAIFKFWGLAVFNKTTNLSRPLL